MEYVEGFTIEQALASGVLSGNARTLDKTNAILEAALHIIDAVNACDRRVVHRDISPANIILTMTRTGDVNRAVLIDWGQSISARSPLVTPALGENRKLATICFGAPCVFGGPFYLMRNEPSVDVYSFGALLYYMRTLELPYADVAANRVLTPETVEVVAAAKREPLTLASKIPSMRAIERKLDGIIGACTAYDPRERPNGAIVRRLIAEALALPDVAQAPSSEESRARAARAQHDGGDAGALRGNEAARSRAHAGNAQDGAGRQGEGFRSRETVASLNALLQAIERSKQTAGNAAAQMEERAERTAGDALFRQATDCFYGHNGAARDAGKSMRLLERAAEAGSVEAMFMLAKSLLFGIGTGQDEQRGTRWLKRAAACGHPGAEAML